VLASCQDTGRSEIYKLCGLTEFFEPSEAERKQLVEISQKLQEKTALYKLLGLGSLIP